MLWSRPRGRSNKLCRFQWVLTVEALALQKALNKDQRSVLKMAPSGMMAKLVRASRAGFGDLGFSGVCNLSIVFELIWWFNWVVRWRILWPGFDQCLLEQLQCQFFISPYPCSRTEIDPHQSFVLDRVLLRLNNMPLMPTSYLRVVIRSFWDVIQFWSYTNQVSGFFYDCDFFILACYASGKILHDSFFPLWLSSTPYFRYDHFDYNDDMINGSNSFIKLNK